MVSCYSGKIVQAFLLMIISVQTDIVCLVSCYIFAQVFFPVRQDITYMYCLTACLRPAKHGHLTRHNCDLWFLFLIWQPQANKGTAEKAKEKISRFFFFPAVYPFKMIHPEATPRESKSNHERHWRPILGFQGGDFQIMQFHINGNALLRGSVWPNVVALHLFGCIFVHWRLGNCL